MLASAEVTFSASQELKVQTPPHGQLMSSKSAISQLQHSRLLNLYLHGHAPTYTLTLLLLRDSAPSKDRNAEKFRVSTLQMSVRRPTSTLHSLLVKLAHTKLDPLRDSLLSSHQIPLDLRSRMSTMTMMTFKILEEYSVEAREVATKLKIRERAKALKPILTFLDPIATSLSLETDQP